MTFRNLIAIGAGALALGLAAAPMALAASSEPQAAEARRTGPPPPNPHDVFRPIVKAPDAKAKARNCDCPMMKGDAAMRDMCMQMKGEPAKPPKG
ncbi:hypothetical protein [Phenylobacterium sp. 58.2.17]|uniref:hypothetical protein n=1 Tax=Phenylobacterium sp. 58.2.17 TaxID=2969306 RepID=UPI0022650CC1|nr:hypothetical protein [Phenylobacterium sp. 58.2.17]MCX7587798.1 hypothetical protein [Phenylobacterium sp. 58.2.17]